MGDVARGFASGFGVGGVVEDELGERCRGVVGGAAGEDFGALLVESGEAFDGFADVGLREAALEFGVGDSHFGAGGSEGDFGVGEEVDELRVVFGDAVRCRWCRHGVDHTTPWAGVQVDSLECWIVAQGRRVADEEEHRGTGAIDAAVDGDEVVVAPGVYFEKLTLQGKNLTLTGVQTALDGTDLGGNSMLYLSGVGDSTLIRGITFQNSTGASTRGGGITVEHSGSPIFMDCVFQSNWSPWGGAARVDFQSEPIFVNCQFVNNVANFAGAIFVTGQSVPQIYNCVFKGNSGGLSGGAMWILSGSSTIAGCLFADNRARDGGAITNNGASRIISCTFTGNESYGATGVNGGGILNGNSASNIPVIANCILWNNIPNQLDAYRGTIVHVAACIVEGGAFGQGILDADPLFADPDTCDYSLLPGSPAIDAGLNDELPPQIAIDLNGDPRFADDPCSPNTGAGDGPIVDIGAQEFQGTSDFCAGDCDSSGAVDFNDLVEMLFAFGPSDECRCDADESGTVDFNDLVAALGIAMQRLAALAVCLLPALAHAAVINVPADHATIQGAIDAAVSGDEIVLSAGTYSEELDLGSKNLILRAAAGERGAVVLDGQNSFRIMSITGGQGSSTLIDGITFTNGHAEDAGALEIIGASPTLRRCTFVANTSQEDGGALAVFGSNATFADCLFENNTALDDGGAIVISFSEAAFDRCVFRGNQASSDGGVFNCSGSANHTVSNSLFVGNHGATGGAVFVLESDPTYINCTFVENTTVFSGDSFDLSDTPGGTVTVTNCILWNGDSDEISGMGVAIVKDSVVQGGFMGMGVIENDPLFVDPMTADFRLASASPALDEGDNTAVPGGALTDLDGNPRVVGGIVDLGAYEFQGATVCAGDCDNSGAVDFNDLVSMLFEFGNMSDARCDADSSGSVDFNDLVAALFLFGPCA
ncbi:unnamed protein product [Symbiodinium necroappetens]|uniref:Probable pectate lyase C n=1 Tax=Symbiodinium necroappetens TaxID=1628268 RepID=A0A812XPT4_9DINO|nr:unnamed protein product [Symbiodinium necroappetens]